MHLTQSFELNKSYDVDNHNWNQNQTHTKSNFPAYTYSI